MVGYKSCFPNPRMRRRTSACAELDLDPVNPLLLMPSKLKEEMAGDRSQLDGSSRSKAPWPGASWPTPAAPEKPYQGSCLILRYFLLLFLRNFCRVSTLDYFRPAPVDDHFNVL
jgi:hypothetical protein